MVIYKKIDNKVQDKATSSAVTGWRLFDVSEGVMTILTGNESLKTTYPSLGLGTTYKARNWDMYVNSDYGATTATLRWASAF